MSYLNKYYSKIIMEIPDKSMNKEFPNHFSTSKCC